jgi:triosephosphate isomerase (TIM)
MSRRPLIAGNWKMNLDHLQGIALVQKLAWTLKDAAFDPKEVEVAVFPPFTDLRSVQTLVDGERYPVVLGAQDLSPHDAGAYTGDVSGAFLKALGCSYVIVGHSERRSGHGETDDVVNAKVQAAVRHGLVPVVCVGETEAELEEHGTSAVPVAQTKAALAGVAAGTPVVIAYEPVWAIGTGKVATPETAQEVGAAIRAAVAEALTAEDAAATRILYGGSVKSGNIAGFLRQPDVDGALVGGASLDPTEFAGIARFPKHVGV